MSKGHILRQQLMPECGPRCSICGGASNKAVRTRNTTVGAELVLYLAEVWACSICGKQWADETLERTNRRASETAKSAFIAKIADSVSGPATVLSQRERPSFPKAHFAESSPP